MRVPVEEVRLLGINNGGRVEMLVWLRCQGSTVFLYKHPACLAEQNTAHIGYNDCPGKRQNCCINKRALVYLSGLPSGMRLGNTTLVNNLSLYLIGTVMLHGKGSQDYMIIRNSHVKNLKKIMSCPLNPFTPFHS